MDNGKHWNLPPERHLIEDLQDRDYRRGFVEGHTTDSIAFQLRAMRRAEGWEQKDVAERLGNAKLQPMISRYENPDYGKYSISTLLELANVFDVALAVRFVPFSELVAWDASANPEKDCPTPFSRDTKLEEIADGSMEPTQGDAKDFNPFVKTADAGAVNAPAPTQSGRPASASSANQAEALLGNTLGKLA
jgi:transcriptional regulator with XRE-family HTH domain